MTWQQTDCSLQSTIVGLLPHVTVERRHLGRKYSERVTADIAVSRDAGERGIAP